MLLAVPPPMMFGLALAAVAGAAARPAARAAPAMVAATRDLRMMGLPFGDWQGQSCVNRKLDPLAHPRHPTIVGTFSAVLPQFAEVPRDYCVRPHAQPPVPAVMEHLVPAHVLAGEQLLRFHQLRHGFAGAWGLADELDGPSQLGAAQLAVIVAGVDQNRHPRVALELSPALGPRDRRQPQ